MSDSSCDVGPRRQPGAGTAEGLLRSDFTTPPACATRVFLESPYAGEVEANVAYARACLADCLRRGEAPYASRLLYAQPGVLDDLEPAERALGIAAGQTFLAVCSRSVVYVDRGVSAGMLLGVAAAHRLGIPVEYRSLEASR